MKRALVVGINNYPDAPLRGCVNDAIEIGQLLQTNDNGNANFHVLLKTNIARRSTLLQLIAELFSGEVDTALLYFSGHGTFNELGGYLVTPDYRQYDEGISMNDILTLANQSKIKNKIIILDCCHSGAITSPRLAHNTVGHISEGITLLTASRQEEVAVEVKGKGVFTNLLIEALKGGAADLSGNITPGGVYAYIDQALGPWDQRPVFKTNVSRFVHLRTTSAKISMAVLRKIAVLFPDSTDTFPLDPSYEFTNDLSVEALRTEPYANYANVAVFKQLQQMQSAGLVEPVGESHMYWAAMKGKSCRLTPLGEHYRRLVRDKMI
jgi:hypothetical protein